MSLSTAMMSALSGLRATQAGMSVVANNVANAGSADFTRKTMVNRENVVAGDGVGVEAGDVTRVLDRLIQRQMWTEGAGGAYTATKSQYHDRLDSLFGTPGDATALDGILNSFTEALQTLSTSPDSATARTEVLNKAKVLAQQLNGMSGDIQSMRSEAELSIQNGVADANDALANIARISAQIEKTAAGEPAPRASRRAGRLYLQACVADGYQGHAERA